MTRKDIIANLKGILVPALTPFKRSGGIDLAAFRHNLRGCLSRGVTGILVLGSTSETCYLTEREKLRLLETARSVIRPPQLLLAGTGLESTSEALAFSRQAVARGADAVLMLPPAYYKAYMTPALLERHFQTVADALKKPVLIYSIPQFTGFKMEPGSIGRLSKHENIVGLKESSGNLDFLKAILDRSRPKFRVFVGSPLICTEALQAGAVGGILANANYIPEAYIKIYKHVQRGELDAASKLQRQLESAATDINIRCGIPGIKYASDLLGYKGGSPRPPLLPLRPAERRLVVSALKKAKIGLPSRGAV